MSPALAGRFFFTTEPPGRLLNRFILNIIAVLHFSHNSYLFQYSVTLYVYFNLAF